MKVREIRLKGFKRFTDLHVPDIPESARLVLLVGPNGSGKSSLIESVNSWFRHNFAGFGGWEQTYHAKQTPGAEVLKASQAVQVFFHGPALESKAEKKKAVYGRTAYRNEAEFQLDNLQATGAAVDENRTPRMIDNDQSVSANYRRLVSQGLDHALSRGADTETLGAFRAEFIGDIRNATDRLFPGLRLNGLGSPLEGGSFRFDKGESKAFLYKNLSGGEKAAFDLLLDLYIKRKEFDDTVFFIDEPEAHVASALQGPLLQELLTAVPERGQLWIATHSLGMMRKAREVARAKPGEVVFFDFDGQNFDAPAVLKPSTPDRAFWKRAMQLALDDIAGHVAPERVVLCEGATLAGGSDFDAACYNTIFSEEFPEVLFLGAGNSHDIATDPRGIARMFRGIAPATEVIRLIDRDDRSNDDIAQLKTQGVSVLEWRTIESYLLDDEVLAATCDYLGNAGATSDLVSAKSIALASSVAAGGSADNLKRVAGDVYNAAKRLFPGSKLGADSRSFMRGFCAPRIVPGTHVYSRLKSDIFGCR